MQLLAPRACCSRYRAGAATRQLRAPRLWGSSRRRPGQGHLASAAVVPARLGTPRRTGSRGTAGPDCRCSRASAEEPHPITKRTHITRVRRRAVQPGHPVVDDRLQQCQSRLRVRYLLLDGRNHVHRVLSSGVVEGHYRGLQPQLGACEAALQLLLIRGLEPAHDCRGNRFCHLGRRKVIQEG